jgi:mono/diheme cytochrome c family protein
MSRLQLGKPIRRGLPLLIGAVVWSAATLGASQTTGRQEGPAAAAATEAGLSTSSSPSDVDAGAVVARYCVSCHNPRLRTGNVVLDAAELSATALDAELWERVVRKLQTRAMPPVGMPRPDEATYASVTAWLEARLDAAAGITPGRPMLHRLNRNEYVNAIRDLLALDVDPLSLFPPDDSADGFDTNAALLGISPMLLERYLLAAARISALAVGDPDISPATDTYRVRADASQMQHVDGLPLGTRGGLVVQHTFPLDGEYVISVNLLETGLGAIRGLEREHELEILVDGEGVHRVTVGGADDYTASVSENTSNIKEVIHDRLRVRVPIAAGPRAIGATFVQKPSVQGGSRVQPFLRSTVMATDHTGFPHIESLTIAGPFEPTGPGDTPSRRRIFTCRPAGGDRTNACAVEIVSALARRGYRRSVAPDEMDALMAFFRMGAADGGFERGVQHALRAILASPAFIFRIERDPAALAAGTPYRVSDPELATRLSFFLWSSIPDDELLDLAQRNQLRVPETLEGQVRRMLVDERAEALVRHFAGQWLHVRNLQSIAPDRFEFPDFDDNLRHAFQREVELFVDSVIREDRNVLELLTADYTFVNERLARHYGIKHIYGSHFRRVTLTEDARKGLLGKGGVLVVTSNPDRTSPVKRGQWILENLLGTPPPPPPPDVPALEEVDAGRPLTMRERMEVHRANPVCASCHQIMDPLGLAMENFDAVGVWRTHEAGRAIDATGELAGGTHVDGVVMLREALLERPAVLVQTITEKLLTYALRRGLEAGDMPTVRAIVRQSADDGYRLSSLILGIVQSAPFQSRVTAAAGQPNAAP